MTEAEWLASADPELMLESPVGKLTERKRRLLGLACCRRVAYLLTDRRVSQSLKVVERFINSSSSTDDLVRLQPSLGEAVEEAWVTRYGAEADANFCVHPAYSLAQAVESAVNSVSSLFDQCAADLVPSTLERGWNNEGGPHYHAAWANSFAAYSLALLCSTDSGSPEQQVARFELRQAHGERVRLQELASQADLLRCIFGNPFRPVSLDPSWLTSTVIAIAEGIYADRAFDRLPILADALEDAGCGHADILAHCRGEGPHARGCWVVDLLLGKE